MKNIVIFCVAQLFMATTAFTQNVTPAAAPSVTTTKIEMPKQIASQTNLTNDIPTNKPNIDLQVKPIKEVNTLDIKIDNSRYYKTDENLKPKSTGIPKVEIEKLTNQQSKPSTKTTE